MNAETSFDWRSGARGNEIDPGFIRGNAEYRYRWLNRFVSGSLGFNEQREFERDGAGGGSSLGIRWDHRQTFDLSTSLNLNLNYASENT